MQLFEETAIETVLWGWITRATCLLWCLLLCSENAQAFKGNTHFCMNTSMNCVVRTNQLKMILCSLDGNGIKLYKSFWYVSPNCTISLRPYHMKGWHVVSHEDSVANKVYWLPVDIPVSDSLRAVPCRGISIYVTCFFVVLGFFPHVYSHDFQVSPSQI